MKAMLCSGDDVLESDQASLCWDCDSKVHCANFLVERHSTSLLCHSCQSTGAKLGPTVSVCEWCMKGKEIGGGVAEEESHGGNEIEAPHESAMPFVPVHRGEAMGRRCRCASGSTGEKLRPTVSVCEQRCMKRKERGGGVAEEEIHDSNEIDWDDDGDGSGDSDGDDDNIGDEDENARKKGLGVVYAKKGR
ncbi:hypothetical protein Scep_012641 [Stephania cephalantha]|uniref:Zinc finger protein n=1 Tax=Stephania cephalantha TaxID=152367 RepID=A0AAP0JH87_9MAGN